MKKLATLLLAAGLVFGAATGASAIDFKAAGEWVMNFELGTNGDFNNATGGWDGDEDNFEAKQRVRLKLDAVASENLSGTVMFEIGDTTWGQKKTGGQLGADGVIVEVKRAYLDWLIPNTDVSVRMGLQGVTLPDMVGGTSKFFDDDAAAIAVNYKFNDNVALTALWARPFNDNYYGYEEITTDWNSSDSKMFDNVDIFALVAPLTFDGVNVTPWVSYGAVGKNAVDGPSSLADTQSRRYRKANTYGDVFAAGLTGEITMADPFRFAWDFEYASYKTGDSGSKSAQRQSLDTAGWIFAALAEYKMDWGTPGIYGWYASGDDDNPYNGSERMFIVSDGDAYFTSLAHDNAAGIGRSGILGDNETGTWGIGARIADMSFLEGLKHTFKVTYFQGTNDEKAVKYAFTNSRYGDVTSADLVRGSSPFSNSHGMLSTEESAMEIALLNEYKIYENLTLYAEASYVMLWLDDDLRHDSTVSPRVDGSDAFNLNMAFVYSF